ncbi:hypothetical protein TGMAS_234200 [Toxoplasma gondii MAS]|uniref:Uncharacterized protein n=1 Tax=Toxoplasma gondii MAS TaxID=943118 RepID=A0A086Q5T4_TOXGO|nr:hypothetical protein TGMAS_234200 [Toxoplasma gondii MAS]
MLLPLRMAADVTREESRCLEALELLQLQVQRELRKFRSRQTSAGSRTGLVTRTSEEQSVAGDGGDAKKGSGGEGRGESEGGSRARSLSMRRKEYLEEVWRCADVGAVECPDRFEEHRGGGNRLEEGQDYRLHAVLRRLRLTSLPRDERRSGREPSRFWSQSPVRRPPASMTPERQTHLNCPTCVYLQGALYRQRVQRACVEVESRDLLQGLAKDLRTTRTRVRELETLRAEEVTALASGLREKEREVDVLKSLLSRALERLEEVVTLLRAKNVESSVGQALRGKGKKAEQTCCVTSEKEDLGSPLESHSQSPIKHRATDPLTTASFELRLGQVDEVLAQEREKQRAVTGRQQTNTAEFSPLGSTKPIGQCISEQEATELSPAPAQTGNTQNTECSGSPERQDESHTGNDHVPLYVSGDLASFPTQREGFRGPESSSKGFHSSPHALDKTQVTMRSRPTPDDSPALQAPSELSAAHTDSGGHLLLTLSPQLQQRMIKDDQHLVSPAPGRLFLVHNGSPYLSCVDGVERAGSGMGLSVGPWAPRLCVEERQTPGENVAKQTSTAVGSHWEGMQGTCSGRHSCSLLSQASVSRGWPLSTGPPATFAPPVSSSSSVISSVSSASMAPPVVLLASTADAARHTRSSPTPRQLCEAGDGWTPNHQLLHAPFQCLQHATVSSASTLSLSHTRKLAPETRRRGSECHNFASGFCHERVHSVHCDSAFPHAVPIRRDERAAGISHYSPHPCQLSGVSAESPAGPLEASRFIAAGSEEQQQQLQTPLIGPFVPLSQQLRSQTPSVECPQPECEKVPAGQPELKVPEADCRVSGARAGSGRAGVLNTITENERSRQNQAGGVPDSAPPARSAPTPASISVTSAADVFPSANVLHLPTSSPMSFRTDDILQRRAKRPAARELPADALLELSSAESECGDMASGFHRPSLY